ncbi:MAG: polymer-forming cytoskeletal protein [Burkholderiales bacterium]|nr:polymer-forming cytoskeletal protein [Burkholderiales bacterium]
MLKPAIYDPPGGAQAASASTARTAATGQSAPVADAPATTRASGPSTATVEPGTVTRDSGAPESRLFVGVNINLKGVEISDCDTLVIEGHVDATVNSKAMEIAKPGTLKGNAQIDVAEIHGVFEGELTARTRLTVHATGRVSGTIRYGTLIVAEGGELSGDVRRLDAQSESAMGESPAAMAASTRAPLSPSVERWSN